MGLTGSHLTGSHNSSGGTGLFRRKNHPGKVSARAYAIVVVPAGKILMKRSKVFDSESKVWLMLEDRK